MCFASIRFFSRPRECRLFYLSLPSAKPGPESRSTIPNTIVIGLPSTLTPSVVVRPVYVTCHTRSRYDQTLDTEVFEGTVSIYLF